MILIDGLDLAIRLKQDISKAVAKIEDKYHFKPTIATIIVGDNPASLIYVNRKYAEASKVGIKAHIIKFNSNIRQEELLDKIEFLNNDPNIHAILVQMPLPPHLNTIKIINSIKIDKDVDGLTSVNAGKMMVADVDMLSLIPCTPLGCIALCKTVIANFNGKNVVVIGKSNLVGKPLAILLLHLGCTVIIAHKSTINIAKYTKQADIIFIAAGSPKLITGDIIKDGAIIIDIGITKQNDKIIGDCDFESCKEKASFITPVPGGVGPMTIAYLLYNTVICLARQNSKILPQIKELTEKWFTK